MALPDHRRADYIARTIMSKLGDSITTTTGYTYAVHHDDPFADPGAARVDETDAEALGWVETRFVQHAAGKRGASIWQLDVWRRVGAEGAADGDPYGVEIDNMCDEIVEAFTGTRANGVQRGAFDVEEWSNPAAPTSTGECMLCITTRGDVGEPEFGPERFATEDRRFRRAVVRYRFTLLADAARGAFYTG